MGDDDAEARRAKRATTWEARRFDSKKAASDADRLYWLAVPEGERALLVWQLSQEAYGIAESDTAGRRLDRSAVRIVRRKG